MDMKLYSPCGLSETPRASSCEGLDLCRNAECPSYGIEAMCRTVGCDDACNREWYNNGMVITSSCTGTHRMDIGCGLTILLNIMEWMTPNRL